MTSAPVRDPLGGHLLTPGKRSAPAHRLPALAASRGAQDGPQRLRVTLGKSQRAATRRLRAGRSKHRERDAVNTESGTQ
jgi:hypothetical protein